MTANQPPAPPQYSPDGHYWWDGTAWQLVQRPAPQQPGSRPSAHQPWGAPAQQGRAPAPRGPRPRKRALSVLLVGVVAVVALVAGLVGGSVAGGARPDPVGPTAPPALPAEFPEVSQRYIPGLTVSAVTQGWQQQDGPWICEEPLAFADGEFIEESEVTSGTSKTPGFEIKCETGPDLEQNPSNSNDAGLWIRYDDESQVREVNSFCSLGPGSQGCVRVHGVAAALVFSSAPDLQQRARDWATQNVDSDGFTLFGGVFLAMDIEAGFTAVPAP